MIEIESAGRGAYLVSRRVRRGDAPHPVDGALVRDLERLFVAFNRRHFKGQLPKPPIRITGRFRRKLAECRQVDGEAGIVWLVFSRHHVATAPADKIRDTVLHEMVHLFQHHTGQPVRHDAMFKAKARELGIEDTACER